MVQEVPTSQSEVLILTHLQVEYQAVRRYLQDIREIVIRGTIYEQGTFIEGGRVWNVVVAEIGLGNINATFETERAIHFFRPALLLSVGIAGGLKDVQLGDVIVATKIYNYETGKAGQDFVTRPTVFQGSYKLEQRARSEARKGEWQTRLDTSFPNHAPRVLIGPLAAGEKVLVSTQSGLFHLLKTTYGDVLAVEMEGYGFLQAINAAQTTEILIVRGISDLLDAKTLADSRRDQTMAAQHAAAFAFQVLAKSTPFNSNHPSSSLSLYYVYSYKDMLFREKLEQYLRSLRELGLISDWHDREIRGGIKGADPIDPHMEKASVILLLISPDFLSSSYSYGSEVQRALQRHSQGESRVIPILLRPVSWNEAPIASLQLLPRNGKPVTLWDDVDDAFFEIIRSIRQICGELMQINQRQSSNQESSHSHPSQSHPLYNVFVKSGTPTVTFVEPTDFEALQHALAQPGRGVVIEGPSGVGKTTAVEKAIEYLANQVQKKPYIRRFSARDPNHRLRLQTLRQWHRGTVIIDDFHRLDSALRQDLVDYLKHLADTSSKSKKLVIVGIPRTGQTLVDASFDVATRIDVFQFGHVSDDLILRMIKEGENALNVFFDRKVEVAIAANGSLNIAQFLCFNLCQIAQVNETCSQLQTIPYDFDAAQSSVLKDLSRKFGEPVRRFASMGGPRDSISMLLLEEMVNSEDGFLSLPLLKSKKPDLAQHLHRFLDENWMELLYRECPECQQHFFFDSFTQALVIDDPQLVFYIKQVPFSILAKEAGKVPTLAQRKVFISYSHNDARWLDRLRIHLKPIEREGIIDLWDDTKIAAGVQWKGAIFEALETSKVAVLLISADFLASDFIAEHELPTLLTQAATGGTIIIPIIVSPCLFHGTALSAFQAVNSPEKSLSSLSEAEREQVLVNVTEAIVYHLAKIRKEA